MGGSYNIFNTLELSKFMGMAPNYGSKSDSRRNSQRNNTGLFGNRHKGTLSDLNLFPARNIPLALVIVIIQMFLYVNAPAIFGEALSQKIREILLLYMIMTFAFSLVYFPRELKRPFSSEIINFIIVFFISAGILYIIPFDKLMMYSLASDIANAKIFWAFIVLYSFVVAYTEELVFRGVLPRYFGDIISNIIFSVFHFYVYSGNYIYLTMAFIAGIVFSIIKNKFGLMGAAGAHAAWNLKVLNAF